MKFTTNRKGILSAINIANSAIGRGAIASLRCLMFKADGNGQITVTGSDGEVTVSRHTTIDAMVDGGFLVDPAKLIPFLKGLNTDDVTFEFDDRQLKVTSGKVKSSFPVNNYEDYPVAQYGNSGEKFTSWTFNFGQFCAALTYTMPAREQDSKSTVVTRNIHIVQSNGRCTVETTDTHHVHVYQIDSEGNQDGEFVLAADVAKLIPSLSDDLSPKDDIEINVKTGVMRIETESMTIIAGTPSGTFPNTEKVIPKSFNAEWRFDGEDLSQAVQRAMPFNEVGKVNLTRTGGQFAISSRGDNGEFVQDLDGDSGDDLDMSIYMSGRFLADAIKGMTTVRLQLVAERRPLVVTDMDNPRMMAVIAPMGA